MSEDLLRFENIHFVPSFHNRLQFSIEVRKIFNLIKPDAIAVELPDIYYSEVIQAVNRLPKLSMLCLNGGADTYSYIPIFPSDSMIEGIRLAKDNSLPISFIDMAVSDYKVVDQFQPPDDYAINSIGLEKFYELAKDSFKSETDIDNKRESNMAFHLNRLSKNYKRVLFIGGLSHWENIKEHLKNKTFMFHPHELENIDAPFLAKPGDKALFSLLEEIPFIVFHYEIARRFNQPFDKWQTIIKLLLEVKSRPLLEEENFTSREMNNLFEYAKKLAFIDDEIIPDLFNLLLAAKQTLGDDYALELLKLMMKYPFKEDDNIPVIDLDKDNFILDGRQINLQRSLPDFATKAFPDNQWQQLELVKKKKEDMPDDYMSEWFFFGFYSHIPEDIILESFIDRTGNKIANEMSIQPKIHEFRGSLMDGLELRETIRNFISSQMVNNGSKTEGFFNPKRKIYVKELKKEKINIGAWLLVFDDELTHVKYPWAMSLSAEHHNESDIVFYATNPLAHPVSKQIIRADYGALLAFKPPLPDHKKIIWEDIDILDELRLYQLTMLSIDLCSTNGILYIASKPPEPYFYKIAEQKNKKLYYLPISRFSNRNIKKLKRFHLLKNRKTRNIADDYI